MGRAPAWSFSQRGLYGCSAGTQDPSWFAPQESWSLRSHQDVPSRIANGVCHCSAGAPAVDPLDCTEILLRDRASPDGNLV